MLHLREMVRDVHGTEMIQILCLVLDEAVASEKSKNRVLSS